MKRQLSRSEVNHLRRLLGWVRCEIGQSPDELVATVKKIAPAFDGQLSMDSTRRLMKAYEKSAAVPLYIRAAIKALEKLTREAESNIIDADVVMTRRAPKLRRDNLRLR